MHTRWFSAVLALAGTAAANADPTPTTAIDIRAERGAAGYTAVAVRIDFRGDTDGESTLYLPDSWAGHSRYYRTIRDLRADGAQLLPAETDTPQQRRLRHAPGAAVSVRYRVVIDGDGPEVEPGQANDYRVHVEPDFVFALGEAYLAKPGHITQDSPVRVSLGGFAPEHRIASDLEHGALGKTLDYGDAVESVLIGGDIRLIDAGDGTRLVIRGTMQARSDDKWREVFRRIAGAQRGYWRSAGEPYLVTIRTTPPPSPGAVSVGGTGRGDAFAFFATDNAEPFMLDRIMAHEMMHTWVPGRIGGLRRDDGAENWLSEGLTDWTAFRVSAGSGHWTTEQFARAFNEKLQAYDLSPEREADNARIVSGFWSNRHLQELPYQRGMLMATAWNARVRAATGGRRDFDDVLRAMQAGAAADPDKNAVSLLTDAMQSVAGLDIAPDLERHIDRGAAIEFDADVFAPCGELVRRERKPFHRGFDIERTQADGGRIAGVVVDGPAWRAGLRDGMRLIRRSGGEIGNAAVEIAYEVDDRGTPKTLRWLPEGEGIERYREFVPKADMDAGQRAVCREVLGG